RVEGMHGERANFAQRHDVLRTPRRRVAHELETDVAVGATGRAVRVMRREARHLAFDDAADGMVGDELDERQRVVDRYDRGVDRWCGDLRRARLRRVRVAAVLAARASTAARS